MYHDEKTGKTFILSPKYKNKLMVTMQDCPEIKDEIQKSRLNHKSLIKLSKDYHEKVCNSESCIIYERVNTSLKVKFGVLTGFSKNRYNFGNQLISNYGNNYHIGLGLKLSNIFMFNDKINIKANFILEKDSKSYTLTKSEDLFQYYVTLNNERYYLGYDPYKNTIKDSIIADLGVVDIKIPITLNYDFNLSKKIILTCGIGISNRIILSQNMDFKIDEFYECYGKNINTIVSGVTATTGFELKLFKKHSIFINSTYEYLLDLRSNPNDSFKLKNNQFSFQLGFYF
jgi:hypothetical protein